MGINNFIMVISLCNGKVGHKYNSSQFWIIRYAIQPQSMRHLKLCQIINNIQTTYKSARCVCVCVCDLFNF